MSDAEQASGCAGRAIITYARGWQTLVATRSLGRHGVEVITGDEYAMTPASFSRYSIAEFRYPNPTKEPEAFLDALEECVLKYKPKDPETPYVLMPIHKETYLIARHRERFEPHIRVPLSKIEDIESVHNKGTMAANAQKRGLPIPRTWIPGTLDEFESQIAEIPLPAFVKIRESAAGVGIAKVKSRQELETTFKEFIDHFKLREGDYPIIQEAVPGDDYCVTTLFDKGKLVTSMTYHNLRSFPAEKGAGVMRETVNAPAMERISADILGPLEWHGVAQLDFRWDGSPGSQPYLIEVNPRFWGGLIQAVESGWDYPWLLYRLAVDGHVTASGEKRFDVRTETPLLAFLATLKDMADSDRGMDLLQEAWEGAKEEVRHGSKRAALKKLFKAIRKTIDTRARFREAQRLLEDHKDSVYDVLSSHDPLPALGILYPLAVFLRHGKVNMELITGETGPGGNDD